MTTARHALSMLLVCLCSAQVARAQEVRLERPLPNLVQVVGGSGPTTWRLRYGSSPATTGMPPILTPISTGRAYFAHGPWLRLLDTANGTVIGRWRFPHLIESVEVTDAGRARVRFRGTAHERTFTVPFDPAEPHVPVWEMGALFSYRISEIEAFQLLIHIASTQDSSFNDVWRVRMPNAASAVPELEDLVRRDPSAPWLRVALAKLQHDANDPRYASTLEDLTSMPVSDFTELFRIASVLDRMPEIDPKFAADVFDLAMKDFLKRDRDPRLVDTIITRLVLFPAGGTMATLSDADRRRYFERLYLFTPTGEATDRAWSIYADRLEQSGDATAAAVWRARARDARESLLPITIETQVRHDQYMLIALGAILAAFLLIATRIVKYGPQRRMRVMAATRQGQSRAAQRVDLSYWSRRERWSLLMIAFIGWLALGHSWTYARVLFVSFALPVHVGEISGPDDDWYIQNLYPPGPERDLLQALSYQTSGRSPEAEPIYRALPQFAESWNNLGVMLARAGKIEESRQAFSRALEVEPATAEAVFNTTGQATTAATQTFQKYVPDRKMIAVPGRERLLRAYLGSAWSDRYVRMLLGPLVAFRSDLSNSDLNLALLPATKVGGIYLLGILVASIILVAFVPLVEATVPPARLSAAMEWAFPGTSPAWRWAGGLALLTWSTLVLTATLQLAVQTPYLLVGLAQPGLMRAFGFDNDLSDLNPSIPLVIGLILALWAVNAVLIRRGQSPQSGEIRPI